MIYGIKCYFYEHSDDADIASLQTHWSAKMFPDTNEIYTRDHHVTSMLDYELFLTKKKIKMY